MSTSKSHSSKIASTNGSNQKSYHFFSIPQEAPLLTGELLSVNENSTTKIYFNLYEEDFVYYQVFIIIFFIS